jgi:hypothetical protein
MAGDHVSRSPACSHAVRPSDNDSLLLKKSVLLALVVAGGLGLVQAVSLLGLAALSGDAPFWHSPAGLIGGTLDIRNALSGYWWFVQEPWRWPLLAVSQPNWPAGTNAELFDIVPIVAVGGKLLHTMFGSLVNPYAVWVTGCFILNAAALALLVRSLGQRSLLGAVVAGAFGAMAPVVQHRFGHMALMAHWLPVLCLAWYFHSRALRFGWRQIAGFVGLCLLASFVHLYLYVMTAALAAAAVLQALLSRRTSLLRGGMSLALLLAAGIVPLWMFGLLNGLDLVQRFHETTLITRPRQSCRSKYG